MIERPGYGFSDEVEGIPSLNTILDWEREALTKLQISGPYILVPHSASGIEAILWAQIYPEEVEAIIGLDMSVPAFYEAIYDEDYLNKMRAAKDEMEEPEKKETKEKPIEKNTSKRIVTMEEANAYLLAVKDASRGIGTSLFLFCVSPIAAAILYALGVGGNAPFTADKGAMFGTIIQTFILAVAVIVFVLSGVKLSKFSHLKRNTFETEYGVDGMVKELMKTNEHTHLLRIIIGVALCFVSVIPLMACSMLAGENDLVIAIGGSVMLIMIGVGIYMLVHTCILWRGFKKLLR